MRFYCTNTGKRIAFNLVERIAKQYYVVKKCPYCGEKHEFEIVFDD